MEGNADPVGEGGYGFGDHVGGDGVGAEDEEEAGPGAAQVFDFDQPEEESEQSGGDSGGDEDVGAGPELLVDGEDGGPDDSEKDEAEGCRG